MADSGHRQDGARMTLTYLEQDLQYRTQNRVHRHAVYSFWKQNEG